MEFLGNHILSIDQFDKDDIVKVFSIAEKMIPYANREKKTRVLQGAILSNTVSYTHLTLPTNSGV